MCRRICQEYEFIAKAYKIIPVNDISANYTRCATFASDFYVLPHADRRWLEFIISTAQGNSESIYLGDFYNAKFNPAAFPRANFCFICTEASSPISNDLQ